MDHTIETLNKDRLYMERETEREGEIEHELVCVCVGFQPVVIFCFAFIPAL